MQGAGLSTLKFLEKSKKIQRSWAIEAITNGEAMEGQGRRLVTLILSVTGLLLFQANALAPFNKLKQVNRKGPYVGVVVPNAYEMNPLFSSGAFKPDDRPYIDIDGRRFHIGAIEGRRSIVVMTGLSMLNAGVTTQQLLDLFRIRVVVHYGIAGSTNSSLNIADVGICNFWAHTGLWNWQRYGQGPDDELSLESNGDYTRTIGYLHFGNYNIPSSSTDNLLNNIWFQPEEVFPTTGTPEERQHIFWVPVDPALYTLASKLENLELSSCLNSTSCLTNKPRVVFGLRGASSNIFLDNGAYRDVLYNKFNVSLVEMESAAVALTCYSKKVPFIVIRSLSDMAGGSSYSNEAVVFGGLAATNSVLATKTFIGLLPLSSNDVNANTTQQYA